MININIDLKDKSYPIIINKGLLDDTSDYIKKTYRNSKIAIITDANVNELYGQRLKKSLESNQYTVEIITVKPGEQSKSFENVSKILEKLAIFNLTRADLIIAFGGGVVGDLAGFCASIYLRGVSYIQIPTTLLSQVDSSVGGKTAVDLIAGKNLAGSFYQPKMVLVDIDLLNTLDKKYISDGMGEIIKYACIYDAEFFSFLFNLDNKELYNNLKYIVNKCICIKKYYVEKDELDYSERMMLNFGHTFGHAIECCFNYKTFTHGEAVGIGMYNITRLTEKYGLTEKGSSQAIKNILNKYGLKYDIPDMNPDKVLEAIKNDKKNSSGILNIIYLKRIGEASINKIDISNIKKYTGELLEK